MKEAREYEGAHILSMVRAHCLLLDLPRLERSYPKEVGPREVDDLRVGLLDLAATVIGNINLCGSSAPVNQLGLEGSSSLWLEASSDGDG